MKDWIGEHKLAVLAGVLLLVGGVYYLYFYRTPPLETSDTVMDKNLSTVQPANHVEEAAKPVEIIVDVKGEVKKPGVYKAEQGERVIDVITSAGGLTEKADEMQVNFAEHLQDEMVIFIPVKGETGTTIVTTSTSTARSPGNQQAKVNLNKADEAELETLPGIGPAKSKAIIEFRETNGPFKVPEDLKKISGIGEKTFEKLKDLIVVQ